VTSAEWSGDGSRIVFTAAGGEARSAVWSQVAAGGSPAEKLFEGPFLTPAATMSPDGKWLLVQSLHESSWDLFRVHLDSQRVAQGYLTTGANEAAPVISPDGKWVALVSDESGRDEVYVRSFPDPSSRVQISVAGGREPAWSPDGSRLYYRGGSSLLAAKVSLSPAFTLLSRDTILRTLPGGASRGPVYDVTRDGRRILAILSDADDFQLVVSPNWITELRRRIAESSRGK
jgi:Tol biopolymer transport system component